MMQFHYIGITYKNAKLNIRDQVSFTDQKKMDFLAQAEELGIHQCIILSTCNRSEVFYFLSEENTESRNHPQIQSGTESLEQKSQKGIPVQVRNLYVNSFPEFSAEEYVTEMQGEAALSYFYRIAAGLESLVLGEDQILGQVREAYDFSKALGYTAKEMNKVVRDAVTCAKKIKTELKISEQPLSVSYIGIRMLQELCGIQGKRMLVIGSGKTAELAIRYLFYYGAREVLVCSRTLGHAKELLEEFPDIQVIPYEDRYRVLFGCPIVISATSAPHIVLKKEKAEHYLKDNFILDLATPRDIDPEIGKLPGITLIDLDILEQRASQNQSERERLVALSKERIQEAVLETEEWMLSCGVDETIESLQQKCEEIVEDTYRYLNQKIPLETREQKILKKMLRASLKRLIREPILELKQIHSPKKQQEYQKVVRELFQIERKDREDL